MKMWYTYTMEYYLAIKKNGIMLFAGKWMEIEIITLSDIFQAQQVKDQIFSLTCGS
jgi:hypothetical protein